MHEETYCGFPIIPIQTFGCMTVYERKNYRELRCPKYVVFCFDKALEEFRTKTKALSWARRNQKG